MLDLYKISCSILAKNPRGYETLHTVHKKRVVGTQTNLWGQWNITCFNCWSTNIPAPILHVKLKFEIGHSTCGTLLNKRRQVLLTEQQQQSICILAIFLPYCYAMQQNDVEWCCFFLYLNRPQIHFIQIKW